MQIEVQQQQVQVEAESNTVSTSPDSNANAVVIKGSDLNALSDDPDELQNELEALAGPSAGPNGGQIYIDGFTGGQLPPKSSIREIRVNQNPFSAEYDRLGYGRIEIFTKPGTGALHGNVQAAGQRLGVQHAESRCWSDDIASRLTIPGICADRRAGRSTKTSSYFVSAFARNQQNENIVEAINPASITAADPTGTPSTKRSAIPPRGSISVRASICNSAKSNTLTIHETYNRVGEHQQHRITGLDLPEQATNSDDQENAVQVSDSWIAQPEPGGRHSLPVPAGAGRNLGDFESAVLHAAGTVLRRRQSRAELAGP